MLMTKWPYLGMLTYNLERNTYFMWPESLNTVIFRRVRSRYMMNTKKKERRRDIVHVIITKKQ